MSESSRAPAADTPTADAPPGDPDDGLGGRPPEDDAPDAGQDVAADALAAGDTGWSAVAAPGHPDGEVDTRS